MDRAELAARIDHTVLGPETTPADVRRVLDEALEHGMNACVPPCYVAEASEYAPSVRLVTVVGFPHGQHAPAVKRDEAVGAWDDGADELDVMVNVGRLRAGELGAVEDELAEVVASVPVPVKAILETPRLSTEESRAAARVAVDAGAAFLKTATGFDGGATPETVELLSRYLPTKASGGITTWRAARTMFEAGAVRIGSSQGATIVTDYEEDWSPGMG